MPPFGGACGGASTPGSLDDHRVELRLVISATSDRAPRMYNPFAMKGICWPTAPAVGAAEATRVATGLAVGTGVISPAMVGWGLGVGVDGTAEPAPITMSSRLKPACGPGVGHTPARKFPNSSNDPVHPPPPPQLLIIKVSATNNTTGAATIHLKRQDIE